MEVFGKLTNGLCKLRVEVQMDEFDEPDGVLRNLMRRCKSKFSEGLKIDFWRTPRERCNSMSFHDF